MDDEFCDFLKSDETAQYLRRSIWTLYDWRKRGVGPRPEKVGGALLYRKRVVDRWIDDGGRLEPWDS
jgi:predicted DNA-binding transcriptional regulator AlpA